MSYGRGRGQVAQVSFASCLREALAVTASPVHLVFRTHPSTVRTQHCVTSTLVKPWRTISRQELKKSITMCTPTQMILHLKPRRRTRILASHLRQDLVHPHHLQLHLQLVNSPRTGYMLATCIPRSMSMFSLSLRECNELMVDRLDILCCKYSRNTERYRSWISCSTSQVL